MNVPTLTMPTDLAREKYDAYREALESREPTPEDTSILLGYKALAAGKQLLDIHQVFRACPVDATGLPRFAIGRASWKWCHYAMNNIRAAFASHPNMLMRKGQTGKVAIPRAFMAPGAKAVDHWRPSRAMVPLIPAPLRPKGDLGRYHVLWEAEWEPTPPTDPILLCRLSGSLYVILAAWDLTDLERAVLAGRFLEGQS